MKHKQTNVDYFRKHILKKGYHCVLRAWKLFKVDSTGQTYVLKPKLLYNRLFWTSTFTSKCPQNFSQNFLLFVAKNISPNIYCPTNLSSKLYPKLSLKWYTNTLVNATFGSWKKLMLTKLVNTTWREMRVSEGISVS